MNAMDRLWDWIIGGCLIVLCIVGALLPFAFFGGLIWGAVYLVSSAWHMGAM